jgi:hypothetical protein
MIIFAGMEIDTSQPPIVFKSQLYTLTGVPPECQKIIGKGGTLEVSLYSWYIYALKLLITLLYCNLLSTFITLFYFIIQDNGNWSDLGVKDVRLIFYAICKYMRCYFYVLF